jgi:formylglycine-generating enzyme required for sulfatase activity
VDGAEMVYVPAGPFLRGDADQSDNPRRTVTLDAFWMYKTPVTVAQYRNFCQVTGRAMPTAPSWGWKEDHPLVNVNWEEAAAYCGWAESQLPTEAQWEKAARGTDGRTYPWGNGWDHEMLWSSAGEKRTSTAPVGSFPAGASPYGCLDMAGNVWQWCADWYDANYIKNASATNPTGPATGQYRVLRGGSWKGNFLNESYFRSTFRFNIASYIVPTLRCSFYGFRGVGAVRADLN